MNKQQIYDYLQENSIWHEITEHKAVYNMAELAEVPCPYPEADAKNLFVRDDKKQNYYLITVKGEKRVNLKAFRKAQGTRNLSFASAEDLLERLALIPGAVTPLGVLNDETRSVQVFLDQDFLQEPGLVGVHPNENTATVWLKTEDLIRIIREHGNEVVTFRCEE
ncbi:MAG: prolyl-tRNA synthetase associated domain-containing protein [Lachnospiraceae bacterium]|nr:prolyl-tRNA synthetase associated domain-containing protein [Lachnospiraceae bacterium]